MPLPRKGGLDEWPIPERDSRWRSTIMSLTKLAEFDRVLGDYVLENIRQYLVGLTKRPKPPKNCDPREYDDPKDFPTWMAGELSGGLAPLWERIWSGLSDDVEPRSLSDAELFGLEEALRDLPPHLARTCVWEPSAPLHRRYVKCVPEISAALTRQTAEEWAKDSMRFAKRLGKPDLPLRDGVAIIRQWLWRMRELLNAAKDSKSHGVPGVARQRSRLGKPASAALDDPRQEHCSTKPESSASRKASAVCDGKEAMVVTGLKKSKLYALFGSGVLKGYRDGKMIRFYSASLADYMKQRENSGNKATIPVARRQPKKKASPTRLKFL